MHTHTVYLYVHNCGDDDPIYGFASDHACREFTNKIHNIAITSELVSNLNKMTIARGEK